MPSRIESLASKRLALAVVLCLCLAVRLPLAVHNAGRPLEGDAVGYAAIGASLARWGGFTLDGHPTAFRTFAYPFFLSIIFRIFGVSYLAIYIVQALLDCLTCLLVWRLARHVTGSTAVALISALIYGIYPGFVLSSARVLTENLTVFLTVSMVYVLVVHRDLGVKWYLVAGAIGGIAALTRPGQVAVPVLLSVPVLLARSKRGRPFLNAAALILAGAVVVAPWTVRNCLVFHALVPLATQGGYSFWPGTVDSEGERLQSIADHFYCSGDPPPNDPAAVKVSRRTWTGSSRCAGRSTARAKWKQMRYSREPPSATSGQILVSTSPWVCTGCPDCGFTSGRAVAPRSGTLGSRASTR